MFMFQKFPTKEPFVEFTGFSNFVSKGFDQSKFSTLPPNKIFYFVTNLRNCVKFLKHEG